LIVIACTADNCAVVEVGREGRGHTIHYFPSSLSFLFSTFFCFPSLQFLCSVSSFSLYLASYIEKREEEDREKEDVGGETGK
jgi:hypothetical protein